MLVIEGRESWVLVEIDVADGNPGGEMNKVEGGVANSGSETDVTSTPEAGLVAAPVCDNEITAADTDSSVVEAVRVGAVVVDGALVVSLCVVLIEAPDTLASFAGIVTNPPIAEASSAVSAPAPFSSPPPELAGGSLLPTGRCAVSPDA